MTTSPWPLHHATLPRFEPETAPLPRYVGPGRERLPGIQEAPERVSPTEIRSDLASIILVNFNGLRVLGPCLEAIEHQTYGAREIIIVDNGSSDGSVAWLREHYPEVRLIEAGVNLGFAEACNVGMRAAHGEYFVLLNTDTIPEPRWLEEMIQGFEDNPEIGATGSKILFLRPFLPVRIEAIDPLRHHQEGYLQISPMSGFAGNDYMKIMIRRSDASRAFSAGELGCWVHTGDTIYFPWSPGQECLWLCWAASIEGRVRFMVGEREMATLKLGAGRIGSLLLEIPRDLAEREVRPIINNAASFRLSSGDVGDRGIGEEDTGQYDMPADVESLCGCAMALRRTLIQQIGGFDPRFFAYFEDSDLCWRARRQGWRLRYVPTSVVRHYHAATSAEGSALFRFLVQRNRLLLALHNAPPRAILWQFGLFFYYTALEMLACLHPRGRRSGWMNLQLKLRALGSTFKHLPMLVWERASGSQGRRRIFD